MTTSEDWTGRVGDVWAEEWSRTDRSFAALSQGLDGTIAAAAPAGPFRALDIGCGAGGTSLALARARPDATIIGIDLSPPLISVARQRTGGSAHRKDGAAPLTFLAGHVLDLATEHAPFDLVYSRHGVMFFDDPVLAFSRIRSTARPGATLVFSCFRNWSLNSFASTVAAAIGGDAPQDGPGPFAFADEGRVRVILSGSGWRDVRARPVDFAYRAGSGEDPVSDALAFLQRIGPAAARLRAASPSERADLLQRLSAVVTLYRTGNAVDFPASAWIWSAIA